MGRKALEQAAPGYVPVRVPDDMGGGWVLLRFEVADGALLSVTAAGQQGTKRPYVWPTRGGRLRAVRHSLFLQRTAEIIAARAEIAARDAEIKRLRKLVGDNVAASQPPPIALAAASL